MNSSGCPRCHRPIPPDAVHGVCPACLLAAGFSTEPASAADDAALPTMEELAPLFPQLEILGLLGRGGMGVVYKARQKSLNRFVALKLLALERGADPAFAERFAREAQALARLDHPHIVTIHDFGQAGEYYYLVMELVDGINLRHLLERGRIAPREALAIVPQVCDALQFAHDHGIVHRDIKPENILIDRRGHAKVADFGLAKLTGADDSSDDRIMGTPGYMAPEQRAHPEQVDHRADIYALGIVLYQMLTGELPDPNRLRPPSQRVALDVRLDEVVLRALETEPSRRYASAREFKTAVTETALPPTAPGNVADDVLRSLSAPAMGLMFSATLNAMASVSFFILRGLPLLSLLLATSALAASGLIVVGARRMRRARDYGLSIAAAILSILTFQAGGLGVVTGLWALIILTRADVRARFRQQRISTEPPTEVLSPPIPEHELAAPSIALAVSSGLGAFSAIIGLVCYFVFRSPLETPWTRFLALVGLPFLALASAFSCVAAWHMRRLRGHGMAIAGAILSILTAQGAGLGILSGIWALRVLLRRHVHASFARNSVRHPVDTGRLALAFLVGGLFLAASSAVGHSTFSRWAEPAALATPPPPPEHREPGAFVFGQRLQRTLKLGRDQRSGVLDLDYNRIVESSAARTASGVVIDVDFSDPSPFSIAGLNGTFVREVDYAQWENFTDAEAYWTLGRGTRPAKSIPGARISRSSIWLFKTPSGATGILRVQGGGSSPAHVNLIWKYFIEVTGAPRAVEAGP